MSFEYSLKLPNGLSVYVSKCDYERLNQHNWYMRKHFNNIGKLKSIQILTSIKTVNDKGIVRSKDKSISYFIYDINSDEMLLHLNNNKLDYRRENLKVIFKKEHNFYKKAAEGSSSRYKGVYLDKRHDTWVTQTKLNGQKIYIGSFKSEDEAGLAYNNFIKDTFGEDTDYFLNVIGKDNRNNAIFFNEEEDKSKNPLKRTQKVYRNDLYSRYRGITVKERKSGNLKYVAAIRKDNVVFPLGSFDSEIEAAKVYNEAFLVLYGDLFSEEEMKIYLNDIDICILN